MAKRREDLPGGLTPQLYFFLRPDLQEYRSNLQHAIFSYFLPGTITPEEERDIDSLKQNPEWMKTKRWLTETKAAEINLCKRQYHARKTNLVEGLKAALAPYRIVSTPSPYAEEAIHFMVYDPSAAKADKQDTVGEIS